MHEDKFKHFFPLASFIILPFIVNRIHAKKRSDWITALKMNTDRITLFTLGRNNARGNLLRLIRAKPVIYPV